MVSTMDKCVSVAATLMSRYYSPDPLHIENNNTTFMDVLLDNHGVLLTMCMPGQACAITPQVQHVASSWIHESSSSGVMPGSKVGMVLSPTKLVQAFGKDQALLCMYPTDGGTDGRDESGCGPMKMDPDLGSEGAKNLAPAERNAAQAKLQAYKELNFGHVPEWKDIPCDFFFDTLLYNHGGAVYRGTKGDLRVYPESFLGTFQKQNQALMGHAVCRPSTLPSAGKGKDAFFIYVGAESWGTVDNKDWRDALVRQRDFLLRYPKAYHWNEIVIPLPPYGMPDIVEAVVYYSNGVDGGGGGSRCFAERQAKLMGSDIPVIQVTQTASSDGRLEFVCPQKEHHQILDSEENYDTSYKHD